MYFEPVKGMTITDMCIWVDAHMHDKDCDDDLLFKYLYFICVGTFCKQKSFQTKELFEDFCFYDATKIWERIRNKDLPKFDRSVLNYIKATFVAHKAQFFKEVLYDTQTLVSIEELQSKGIELYRPSHTQTQTDFRLTLENISNIVKSHLKYRVKHKYLWNDIYISCLASLISAITPHSIREKSYSNLINNNYPYSVDGLARIYEQEESEIVLFRLDESYRGYINVLVKELKRKIAKELSQCIDCSVDYDYGTAYLVTTEHSEDE